jgi:hypothetical protein
MLLFAGGGGGSGGALKVELRTTFIIDAVAPIKEEMQMAIENISI